MRSFDSQLERALPALSPAHVAAYLRDRGWVDGGPFGPFGRGFKRDDNRGSNEVILPMRQNIADFVRRMAELVEKLSDFEDRPVAYVVQDLSLAAFDVIRVRSLDADQFGSIRFAEGIAIHDEAKKLVAAAALAANSDRPRRAYKGRRPETVTQYLEKVRLGQTENASFSITILSPYSFNPAGQGDLLDDVTFGRKVTSTFANALSGVSDSLALAVIDSERAFENAEVKGVSSEFCSSLAELADNGLGVEVSVAWSPSKPRGLPQRINLNRQDAEILREVSQTFAQAEPEPSYTVRGRVKALAEPDRPYEGSFKIEAYMPEFGGLRTVSALFGPDDRADVLTAMNENMWIQVTGDLSKNGRTLVLERPTNFKVIQPSGD
jgi:hypothetical protein